jgi:acyl carrier protein|tara:strand:- start:11327 stop:11557 length:231 start_codon:yes stop_codon:yes gene_type:complete
MNIFEQVQKVISTELNIPKEKIKEDSHLFDDLNFDSLDSVEVVLAFENEFDIEIADDDIDDIKTVKDLIALVNDLA